MKMTIKNNKFLHLGICKILNLLNLEENVYFLVYNKLLDNANLNSKWRIFGPIFFKISEKFSKHF